MALLWPLFALSAWAQTATVLEGATMRALLWPLFARLSYDQPATVVSVTTGEDAALASFISVGVGSASHCGGGHDHEGAALASVH
jgi:hypothetical protein